MALTYPDTHTVCDDCGRLVPREVGSMGPARGAAECAHVTSDGKPCMSGIDRLYRDELDAQAILDNDGWWDPLFLGSAGAPG